jgi:hypothetical protein
MRRRSFFRFAGLLLGVAASQILSAIVYQASA